MGLGSSFKSVVSSVKNIASGGSSSGGFGGIFGTAGSILGSLAGPVLGAYGGHMTNEANSAEAQKNRDWQEYMSNTAHQREVKDLRAAGLNPILSARLGGSSMGSGAQAQLTNPMAGFSNDLTSARKLNEVEKVNLELDRDLKRSQSYKNYEDARVAGQMVKTQQSQESLNSAAALRQLEEIPTLQAQQRTLSAQMQQYLSQAAYNSAQRGWTEQQTQRYAPVSTLMGLINEVMNSVGFNSQGIKNIRSTFDQRR